MALPGPTPDERTPGASKQKFDCPHCATYSVQTRYQVKLGQGQVTMPALDGWAAHVCLACNGLTFWQLSGDTEKLVFPGGVVGEAPSVDMPPDVVAIYEEARQVAMVSRRSGAALLRLALQMLVDQIEPGNASVNTKIGQLVKRGLHPQTQQAMDVLRVIGNNAVHPGRVDLDEDPSLLPGLFRIANTIVDQMITVPQHAQSLYASLPQVAKDQVDRRDT